MFNRNAATKVRASADIVAHFAGAYTAAVGVSASVFAVQTSVVIWLSGGASSVPMPDRLFQSVLMSLVIALAFAFLAVWLALVPAVVSVVFARWLGIESMFYYAVCGALSAILLAPVTVWLVTYDDIVEFPPTFEQQCIRAAFFMIVPAIVGAIAFWFVDRRLRVRSLVSDNHIR